LLVQQADPEAAAEDLSPEVLQEVTEQAQMSTTEQLLRVVDGLADVDARMRWASNKRLHFELGIIASVQSLNEVSISDVIEALEGGGGGVSLPRPAPRPQSAPLVRRTAAPESTTSAPVRAAERPASPAPAVVREERPAAAEPPPRPAPQAVAPVEDPPEPVAEGPLSDEELWRRFTSRVQERRQLIAPWMQMASLVGIKGNTIRMGFPESESFARDSLMRPAQVSFLEGIAQEITGQTMKIEMVLDPSLKSPEFSEMGLGLLDDPPPAPPPVAKPAAAAPAPAPVPAAAPPPPAVPVEAPADPVDDEFHKDPLIVKALEKFKARLVTP
jgi:DNA polymerase-3 subunit gamma/tau